jgi:predicted protein tyrosine phosphatase
MIYPSLSILGIDEVRQLSEPRVDYLLSILASNDVLPRPEWIQGDHYLVLIFDDLDDPDFQDGIHVPPTPADLQNILAWGRQIDQAQRQEGDPLSVLIHCTAGVSRSTAAAYAIWCDWLGAGQEAWAAAEVRKVRPKAAPNRLMVMYADQILGRKGRMVENAAAFFPE